MESKNKKIPNFYSSQLITMNNNTFRNNIRRYILGDDGDTGMDIPKKKRAFVVIYSLTIVSSRSPEITHYSQIPEDFDKLL